MSAVKNPIALAAMERALSAARAGPAPRPKYNSRTADKFVIRGFEELFGELAGIGLHQGRSKNSESIAAILDALSGKKRSTAMLGLLKAHLGDEVAGRVLAEVPDFELKTCKTPDQFVVRLPQSVRETIRDGVVRAISIEGVGSTTMNRWLLHALVEWVNFQRQHYAMLTAMIALDQAIIGNETI